MPDETAGFWPEDLGRGENFITPAAVLKQAASELGSRTQQLVTANVSTEVRGNRFYHQFWVEVPSLEYRYKLLEIDHPVDSFYPSRTYDSVKREYIEVDSEDGLREYLKRALASEKTRKLVETLLMQVRS